MLIQRRARRSTLCLAAAALLAAPSMAQVCADLLPFGFQPSFAADVSDDGRVVVGTLLNEAAVWSDTGGLVMLGTLGGASSQANAVSADGRVVVGLDGRWTELGGVHPIVGLLTPSSLNADGSVAVGEAWVPGAPLGFTVGMRVQSSVLGQTYCRPSVPNSTGCGGIVLANGDLNATTGALDLTAMLLPSNAFGFFVTSQSQGNVPNAGGGQGTLCLGGNIGRFVAPDQIMNSGPSGTFSLTVDPSALPTPTGLVAALPGETWHFQAWHRDAHPTATSNLTDAVSLTFH